MFSIKEFPTGDLSWQMRTVGTYNNSYQGRGTLGIDCAIKFLKGG